MRKGDQCLKIEENLGEQKIGEVRVLVPVIGQVPLPHGGGQLDSTTVCVRVDQAGGGR